MFCWFYHNANHTNEKHFLLFPQELSSQLHDMDTRANGWSVWSEWSSCSRSCDGGVSHQLRTCQKGSCKGEHIRYKICNMQVSKLVAINCGRVARRTCSLNYTLSLFRWRRVEMFYDANRCKFELDPKGCRLKRNFPHLV